MTQLPLDLMFSRAADWSRCVAGGKKRVVAVDPYDLSFGLLLSALFIVSGLAHAPRQIVVYTFAMHNADYRPFCK
jgi:hypothetical protein